MLEGNYLLTELERLLSQGLVRCERHESLPMSIWHYTRKAYKIRPDEWPETLALARGLVTYNGPDIEDLGLYPGKILARGYRKFWEGRPESASTAGPFSITEKIDGSMILAFDYLGRTIICTKKSFHSWHAKRAEEIFRSRYSGWHPKPNLTYLFELVTPENPVIIRYEKDELYLLDALRPDGSFDAKEAAECCFFPSPKGVLSESWDVQALRLSGHYEGWVVRNIRTGEMWKAKTWWYDECSELMAMSLRQIGEFYLSHGPEETEEKINTIASARPEVASLLRIWIEFRIRAATKTEEAIREAFNTMKHLPRKEFAERVLSDAKLRAYSTEMFALYDGRSITQSLLAKALTDSSQTVGQFVSEMWKACEMEDVYGR